MVDFLDEWKTYKTNIGNKSSICSKRRVLSFFIICCSSTREIKTKDKSLLLSKERQPSLMKGLGNESFFSKVPATEICKSSLLLQLAYFHMTSACFIYTSMITSGTVMGVIRSNQTVQYSKQVEQRTSEFNLF